MTMHSLRSAIRSIGALLVLGLIVGPAMCQDNPLLGIARIAVFPQQVSLRSAREMARLIVTGYDSAGTTRDLTHAATIRSLNETIAAVEAGRVVARNNGSTQVEIRVGEQRKTVTVETTNIDQPDPIRFRSEVLPVLTKQGCNAGSCHGAPEGKGGFALSMLAYKPAIDEDSLTTGGLAQAGRAIWSSDESLLLKKPLLRVTHVGGKRLHPGDVAFRLLRDWVAEGYADRSGQPATLRRHRRDAGAVSHGNGSIFCASNWPSRPVLVMGRARRHPAGDLRQFEQANCRG